MDVVLRLQLVTLFDSICFGLIHGYFSIYIKLLGGTHVTIGIFTCLYLICHLISNDIMDTISKNGSTKLSLIVAIMTSAITNFVISLSNHYWFIILARCIFNLTNHTSRITKEFLLQNVLKEESDYYESAHNFLSSVGLVIGPIITGCLFAKGYSYSCLIATFLSCINIALVISLPEHENIPANVEEDKHFIEKWGGNISRTFGKFSNSNFRCNWDLIALKFLFTSSMMIFYTKFSQTLRHNFDSSFETIGLISAYMTSVIFFSTFVVNKFKPRFQMIELKLMHIAFVTLFLSVAIACYAPMYIFYILICIPLSISQSYINSVWKTLFSTRKNESLSSLENDVAIIAGLSVPLSFGIVCNSIQYNAVIIYSIFPLLLSLYIFQKFTLSHQVLLNEDLRDKNE